MKKESKKESKKAKDGLPTAHSLLSDAYQRHGWLFQPDVLPSGACPHENIAMEAMQEYSDQQNAELREQNRKNQSRWAKDRVAQDKKHDADMMEACGKIVDLEERVKALEAQNKRLKIAHYTIVRAYEEYGPLAAVSTNTVSESILKETGFDPSKETL